MRACSAPRRCSGNPQVATPFVYCSILKHIRLTNCFGTVVVLPQHIGTVPRLQDAFLCTPPRRTLSFKPPSHDQPQYILSQSGKPCHTAYALQAEAKGLEAAVGAQEESSARVGVVGRVQAFLECQSWNAEWRL